MKSKQAELVSKMSDQEIKFQLFLSQFIMFILAICFIFLFGSSDQLLTTLVWDFTDILYYGIMPGIIVVIIDMLMIYFLPKHLYDDGGINERVFKNRTILEIFLIALTVAITEEVLFRGVIQSELGYIAASLIFATVHFRYLFKPVLLLSIFILSFYLGFIFEITNNLFVTIIAHFIIDFCLALVIKFQAVRRCYYGSR